MAYRIPIKPSLYWRFKWTLLSPFWKPGVKDLFFYSIGLRSAISAGVPVGSAFEIMGHAAQHRLLKEASLAISQGIASGLPLEENLRTHRKVFGDFFINIFIAGLRAGSMDMCMDTLTDHYSWLLELRTLILRVIWYPLANLILGTFIMAARDLIIHFMNTPFTWREGLPIIWFYLRQPVMGIFCAFVFSRILKDRRVRPFTDPFIIKIPIFGGLYKKYLLAIFFRLFGVALEAGQEITKGFREAVGSMDNYYLARRLEPAIKFMAQGDSVHEAFYMTGIFDPQALGMVAAGEQSGFLPDLCHRMAKYYFDTIKATAPGIIAASYPLFVICIALAFFVNPLFLYIGCFLACALLFMFI